MEQKASSHVTRPRRQRHRHSRPHSATRLHRPPVPLEVLMRLDCFSRLCEMITCDRCSSSIFRFQDKKVPLSPMCIVQIAPNMRSFGPVHHTTKVARHVLHLPHTHTTRTQHTLPLPTHPLFTPYHHHHHTQRPHHHHKHRHASFTSHTPRLYYHAPKNTSTKDRYRKQISPYLRNLLATKSSGHCQKKFAAVVAHMTSTTKTTNANFTISFETAIMI